MSKLVLRTLTLNDEKAFLRVANTPTENGQVFALHYHPDIPFSDYVKFLEDQSAGRNLPEGFVPGTMYFAFVNGEIVGRLSLRHELNDYLLHYGGHVGYGVVPQHRRKGYATEMMRQAIHIAKTRGLARLLVTCDFDNIPSIKVIEKFHGVLESIYSGPSFKKPTRRYWINLQELELCHL